MPAQNNSSPKVALITAGASGIGLAIANALRGQGYAVFVVDVSLDAVNRFNEKFGADRAIQCDVADPIQVDAVMCEFKKQLNRIDVLVNNAGTTTFVPHDQLDALTEDIWLRTLRVNLVGAFMMSREVAPHIEAAGGGEIVMTSSIASTTANGSSIAYCASKAGMNSLTRTLAKTLGKRKIRVNAVLPGLIDGDWAFNTWGGGDAEQYEGLKKMFAEQTALGHVVTPADVADTIISLMTGSDYVTGQLVTLDSGFTL